MASNQEFSTPVPSIDELKSAGVGAIAVEAAEHAKDMEYARSDPDQSASVLIDEYDKGRTAQLDKAHAEASSESSEKLAKIRADLEKRQARGPKVMGPDGQLYFADEIREQNIAANDGALDKK